RTFLEWEKTNSDAYLANAFLMMDAVEHSPWQIGYYDKKDDRMTTFNIGKKITQNPEAEVFKKKKVVEKLLLSKVKIGYTDALGIAKKHQEGKFSGNTPLKKIILLQHLDKGHLYNITFITPAFKTLNIKVSSEDGHVISDKLTSIFDFQKK
ncbi:hypothetical protein GOV08_02100, partial [Candidatus Woesearchaeota archaeon]|nr:hypothetical protein [Candidatus Woesearchaeota archaeon]